VDLERLGISEVLPAPVDQKRTRRRWVPLVLTPVMIVLAVYLYFFTELFVGEVQALDSVAVLPFANLSDDPDAEYLSEGITDSLINSLAELPTIKKVIARGSVFEYKGQEVDPRVVGRDLGVKAVVTGRVVQQGENLSISVALVQARDSRHLWGDRYQRSMTEIFDVQEDIVSRISEGLRLELTGEEKERLTKRQTVNTDAYKLYLMGRYHLNSRQFTQTAIDKAIGYFKQALEQDPGYALAYVGMADCYYGMSNIYIPSAEAMPKMKAAAIEALKRDDALGEPHATLGLVKALFDRDWWGAEREFERAIELNPSHAPTHMSYALILSAMGRFDQAVAEAERTLELDPLAIHVKAYTAVPYYLGRRYDDAQARLQETIDEDPDYFLPHAFLGLVYEQKGEPDKSVAAFQRAIELPDSSLEALAQLGRAYAVAGQRDKAEEVLEQLRALLEDQFVSAYNFAAIHAALGQNDEAIDWLFRADEERSEWFPMLKIDPRFDSLKADPRYPELIRRTGLPD
jgi:TolB-like protein/Flp pilus assembly protein TadD